MFGDLNKIHEVIKIESWYENETKNEFNWFEKL